MCLLLCKIYLLTNRYAGNKIIHQESQVFHYKTVNDENLTGEKKKLSFGKIVHIITN
jgi:hypothetical protein